MFQNCCEAKMFGQKKTLLLLLLVLVAFVDQNDARKEGKRGKGGRVGGGHPLRAYLFPKWNHFDAKIPPIGSEGEPLVVEVNTFVRELGPLNMDQNEFQVQLTFRQKFTDSRLTHTTNEIGLVGDDVKSIWQPDTFFRNERTSIKHSTIVPNIYARISSAGEIMISQRITLVASCANLKKEMEATNTATCSVSLASYGRRADVLQYKWREENAVQFQAEEGSFLNDGISLSSFDTEGCDVTTSTGVYSCLKLNFHFVKN